MPDEDYRYDSESERRGGYAEARTRPVGATWLGSYALAGLVAGLIAGLIFAIMEMIGAAMMGQPALMPIRMFASILLGQAALSPSAALGTVIVVATISHFVIAAFWGVIFGLIAGAFRRQLQGLWAYALAGVIFGTLVWLIDFYVLAPLFWPWFLMANPVAQFILHALFFGLPLGLLVGYWARRRTGEGRAI